jgi:hypothetical protein
MRILKKLGSGKSILVEMGRNLVFFRKSAEWHEKKGDEFLVSAKSARKCKRVRRQQEVKEIHEVKETKE